MSYTPTTWETGDVITADRLNNIEQGVLNAGSTIYYVDITYDDDDGTYSASDGAYLNINNALLSGKIPQLRFENDVFQTAFYSGSTRNGHYFCNISFNPPTGMYDDAPINFNAFLIKPTGDVSVSSQKLRET